MNTNKQAGMKDCEDPVGISQEVEQERKNGSHNGAKSGTQRGSRLGKWFWFWAILLILVIMVRYVVWKAGNEETGNENKWFGGGTIEGQDTLSKDVQDQYEKLKTDFEERHVKFKHEVEAIREKYREQLPLGEAESYFKEAEHGVDFIASREGLCGFNACAKLSCKMAYDGIKGTKTAEEAIDPIVTEKIVNPIKKAASVYAVWTKKFREEIKTADQEFSQDLAMRSHKFRESISAFKGEDVEKVGEALNKLESDIRKHAGMTVLVGVSGAVELATIKSSYVAIRDVVVKIASYALAAVAKKLGTTASSAVLSSLADGPLPFGEIVGTVITIGGVTWTAYDIYKLTKSMPEDMRTGVLKSVNEAKTNLLKSVKEELDKDVEDCLKSADERVGELLKVIR